MKRRGQGVCLSLAVLGSLWGAPVQAGGPLELHGFASQGYLYSNGNDYYGPSRDGSFELTELGINARYAVTPSLSLAAQVVSRRAGELYDGDPRLDYGFVDYRFLDGPLIGGVRLGRAKIPIGFYNETRDVATTRPGILLPQTVYVEGLGVRDFYIGADGLHTYWQWFTDRGLFQFDLGVAVPATLQEETQAAFLRTQDAPGDLKLTSGQNARLLYERDGGALRLGATYSRVRTEYRPGDLTSPPLAAGETSVDALVLSAEWNRERLSLTTEGVIRRLHPKGYGPLTGDAYTEAGYYLQGTYRFNHQWEGVVRHEQHWNDTRDRSGTRQSREFEPLPGVARAPHRFYQHQWTVGAGWRPTPQWLLRAEWHHIEGTALTPLADNPQFDQGGGQARWDLFALQASYTF
ncbi:MULTISPECIES: hypothetical protein [unclassified Ectothiorhodospira]|uniref:hypothetical protein n=1 Tax=unclassified Ectothiorhodospira TaxID=2684909 RepID=UPI001EE87DFD|nr:MULTISPECIES: hypothetical protein [unclassified Ectothiorhodospira]MCG5516168.1 hypothetical protein [Ectothiorhodospira sp. 9100]MCG5519604.1 hypothetical protein [Ectothiorhodospira sp. 9905]